MGPTRSLYFVVGRHHCLCKHRAEEPSVLTWSTQERVSGSLPHGMQAGTHSCPHPPPFSWASSCKLFPCSRGGSSTHKGEPKDLTQFPPYCVKIEQQIHWFSSTKQAALPAMAVPAHLARESQSSAVAGCEEDMG